MPAQRSVARTGLLLAGVLALCRIASLGKELLIAGRFGAGDQIDAYALALLVPALALALEILEDVGDPGHEVFNRDVGPCLAVLRADGPFDREPPPWSLGVQPLVGESMEVI